MRKRITAGLLAAAIASATLVPATSAFASAAQQVDFSVSAPDTAPATENGVVVTVTADSDTEIVRLRYGTQTINLRRVAGDRFQGTFPLDGAKAGETRNFKVEACDRNGHVIGEKSDTIHIKDGRQTARYGVQISLKASKTFVRAGKKITLSGYLKSEHSGERVRISFKASGDSEYTYVTSTTTDSNGYYSKRVTADEDGTWKVSFRGSVSRTVYVNTK